MTQENITGIEWTDVTWNPTAGCDKVSGGCNGCYAIPHAKGALGFWNWEARA